MKVNFYATLRQIVGEKTVEFSLSDGATVLQLVDEVVTRYPDMRLELLDENGELHGHVHVIVNGRDSLFLGNMLETVLSPNDTVDIFPAIGGG